MGLTFKGKGSGGYASGTAFVLKRNKRKASEGLLEDGAVPGGAVPGGGVVAEHSGTGTNPEGAAPGGRNMEKEWARFLAARKKVIRELDALDGDIFSAHREMAEDPALEGAVCEAITAGESAEDALRRAAGDIMAQLRAVGDEYLASRADDVKDVCSRMLSCLMDEQSEDPFAGMPDDAVIFARELLPSHMARMPFHRVRALVIEQGSPTSHVCIMAKGKGIPYVIGTSPLKGIEDGEQVLVEGDSVTVGPGPAEKEAFEARRLRASEESRRQPLIGGPVMTRSGRLCHVYANASGINEVSSAIANDADGIGLLRSEFFFMSTETFPGEEEQFGTYKAAAIEAKGKPLVIRTMDLGGDKVLPYLGRLEKEENPYLGIRGIRVSLARKDIFKLQVRAILRASEFGDVRIMLPMVSCVEEVLQARELIQSCANELGLRKLPGTGVMVETPASVFIADKLAEVSDFFSIGTNDLTQYIMAADRSNPTVSYLYDQGNPAVRKAISLVAEAAAQQGIPVEVCGDAAADPAMTSMLIKAGIAEFSVPPSKVQTIKRKLRTL